MDNTVKTSGQRAVTVKEANSIVDSSGKRRQAWEKGLYKLCHRVDQREAPARNRISKRKEQNIMAQGKAPRVVSDLHKTDVWKDHWMLWGVWDNQRVR